MGGNPNTPQHAAAEAGEPSPDVDETDKEEGEEVAPEVSTVASEGGVKKAALLLTRATLLTLALVIVLLPILEQRLFVQADVPWTNSNSISLRSGPAWF